MKGEPVSIFARNIDIESCITNGKNIRSEKVDDYGEGIYVFEFEPVDEGEAIFKIAYTEDGISKEKEFVFTVTAEEYEASEINGEIKAGDANCDGTIDMGDAVLTMQSLANPQKYGLNGTSEMCITNQGIINSDVDDSIAGVTNNDALKIQKYLLGIIKEL